MVNNPPNCGYSQETLYSRAVVLKSATEAVMDLTAMPSYRQQPGQLAIELLYSDLPGALALLQEAGELQTVLDWGGAWLRDNAADSKTKDVALALALAHCDTAAMQMEENPSDTLRAIEEMTTALHLLRQHAAGLQLQQEIKGALQVQQLSNIAFIIQVFCDLCTSCYTPQGVLSILGKASAVVQQLNQLQAFKATNPRQCLHSNI